MAINNTISEYFAEPNLPQKYIETLGAPFGERYVYQIFMQGINVLPNIPSSAEGSELTARIKEESEGLYYISEFYYVKTEGEWVYVDGEIISQWTEKKESSNVFLYEDSEGYLIYEEQRVSYAQIDNFTKAGVIPWLVKRESVNKYAPLANLGMINEVFGVTFKLGVEVYSYKTQYPTDDDFLRSTNVEEQPVV